MVYDEACTGTLWLYGRALSVHLIEGIINQVEGKVRVTWVQPRVLLKPQIKELSGRLDTWIEKVKGVSDSLVEELPQLNQSAMA